MNEQFCSIASDVVLEKDIKISKFVNLYGCIIGAGTKIGAFVEIQKKVRIGKNCKISSHSFICEGVSIGDSCFIGHGVVFVNDNYPRATNKDGSIEEEKDWKSRFVQTSIGNNVSIGSNSTILGNIKIGNGSLIGAASVVTKNVPPNEIWAGNPAKFIRIFR